MTKKPLVENVPEVSRERLFGKLHASRKHRVGSVFTRAETLVIAELLEAAGHALAPYRDKLSRKTLERLAVLP